MSKVKTRIRSLQEKHKELDRLTTDAEQDRNADRSTKGKWNLVELKKEKLAIRELLDRYCDGVNQRDAGIWGSTWSENAVWEIPHLEIKKFSLS